ncbi:PREDICTED: uncharacterized protein LOC109350440 [Lupinus angustifolius]|uniref:uncharacterized protein LOC109350440 n=1 Tax=Lupinus angustifolius TaxID=3871 RepID=UPI00092E556C|nr:PREDICTED: uncharacterized protein LOC109350440 [Lupinus angustifolius]
MTLKTKNKLEFIDGSLPKPHKTNPSFSAWDRCNTLVISWINQSIDKYILQSVLWLEASLEVWKDLKERYYQGDVFRIGNLQEELYSVKQGGKSINAYYTHLKGLWQELDNFRSLPQCPSHCDSELYNPVKSYRENDYAIRFLKGLNEQYGAVRSQIILIVPLPTINKAFSLLIQQKRQIMIEGNTLEGVKILVNTSNDMTNKNMFKGKDT